MEMFAEILTELEGSCRMIKNEGTETSATAEGPEQRARLCSVPALTSFSACSLFLSPGFASRVGADRLNWRSLRHV